MSSQTSQQHPPLSKKAKGKLRAAPPLLRLPSIVPGDLVQPSPDPETGLAIFPRLPEVDEEPGDVFESQDEPSPAFWSLMKIHAEASHAVLDAEMQSSSMPESSWSLSRCMRSKVRRAESQTRDDTDIPRVSTSRVGTGCSHISNVTVGGDGGFVRRPGSARRTGPQPVVRKEERSGGHVYCKHTMDDNCKCRTILSLAQGDYCDWCWAGHCAGWVPYYKYPLPTSIADQT